MNKTILVTGCSSGLGYELCKQLLNKKYVVIGLSRKIGKAKKFEKNTNFNFYECDFRELSNIVQTVKQIKKNSLKISILINNASVFSLKKDYETSDQEMDNIINTNINGTIKLTRNMIKVFNISKIFNILSVSSLNGLKNQALYSASKHALKGYFESLARENINKKDIINFYPGGIDTELWKKIKNNKINPKKFMSTESVALYIINHINLPKDLFVKEIVFFPRNDWH